MILFYILNSKPVAFSLEPMEGLGIYLDLLKSVVLSFYV